MNEKRILSRLKLLAKQLNDLEDPLFNIAKSLGNQELKKIEAKLRSTRAALSILMSDIQTGNI